MVRIIEETLVLEGKGETEKEAFQTVFQQIKPQLERKYDGILIEIKPKDVKVVDGVIRYYTEKFLGVLFPRKRTMFMLKVQVVVQVCCLDTKDISYRQENEQLFAIRHIMEMR